jgi:hypothetical protein
MDSITCEAFTKSPLIGVEPCSTEKKIFRRRFDLSKSTQTKVMIRLEIILIDKFETGDELTIGYGDEIKKILSDEVHDHYDFLCGEPNYRDRLVSEVLEIDYQENYLEITIELKKGDCRDD